MLSIRTNFIFIILLSLSSFGVRADCIKTYKEDGVTPRTECINNPQNYGGGIYRSKSECLKAPYGAYIITDSGILCTTPEETSNVEEEVVIEKEEIVENNDQAPDNNRPDISSLKNDTSAQDAMKKLSDQQAKEAQDNIDETAKALRDKAQDRLSASLQEAQAEKDALKKITDACTGGIVNAGGTKFNDAGIKDKGGKRKNNCSLYKPWKRMTVGLIGAGLAGLIAGDAAKQYGKAKERIKELERIRDSLADSAGQGLKGCTQKDFDDPQNPTCYCYSSSGSINNNRDPQGVCAALFPYYKPPIISGGAPTLQGCVNLQGSFDRDCQCRQQTKNGQNNCQKVQKLNLSGIGGNAKGLLAGTLGRTNDFLAGNIEKASAGSGSNAQSLTNFARKVASKASKKPSLAISKFIDDQIKAVVNNPSLQQGGGASDLGSQGLASLSTSLPNSLKEQIDKKTGGIISKAEKGYGNSGRSSRGRSSNQNDEFDISIGESGAVDITSNDEFMAKKYDYKDSDIFKDSSASIFKLLSVRYQRSAYKRLLNEVDPDTQKAKK